MFSCTNFLNSHYGNGKNCKYTERERERERELKKERTKERRCGCV